MTGCDISTVCLSKRPGRRKAENEEQCYAKYDKTVFHKHLADRANCIYHKLALEFEVLEVILQKFYGDRVILFFRQSNIPYAYMYRFICREARTLSPPEYLMVDCSKTILEIRKWASFYTNQEKVNQLKNVLKRGNALKRTRSLGKCSVSASQTGRGSKTCHGAETGIGFGRMR